MTSLTKLTVLNLLNTYSGLPEHMKNSPTDGGFMISTLVIRHFFGIEWLEKHIYPHATRGGFMRLDANDMERSRLQAFRVIDLSELLMNLQNIEGFAELIERMKTHDPEPYMAELRVGRILYINDANFRFIPPAGKERGSDYDLEIIYPDGTIVCGETKCKIEGTAASAATIENALKHARKQLPDDRPGMIFVMVPQQWLEKGAERLMIETAIKFFKGTSRVVSIKFYTEPLAFFDGKMSQGHKYKELSNPHNKFQADRKWDLLYYKPNSGNLDGRSWDALPDKWIRLVNFPYELGAHGKIRESTQP